jgi:hypothetical protein
VAEVATPAPAPPQEASESELKAVHESASTPPVGDLEVSAVSGPATLPPPAAISPAVSATSDEPEAPVQTPAVTAVAATAAPELGAPPPVE